MQDNTNPVDLFIIGGGINGCGIARDAAGRGMSVTLAEMGDLASATSSASTKLFHGGLRYLEYLELRLVREALVERETLLRAMPHISWPMRFVLPYHARQRFDTDTPVSRILGLLMPWTRGRRPAWMIRFGLWLYDHLGGRKILPGTRTVDLHGDPVGEPLKPEFRAAYEYSDCWVDDARLVVLNARDAADRGAEVMTRTKVVEVRAQDGLWQVMLEGPEGRFTRRARKLVNAAGPWAMQVIHDVAGVETPESIRLVRGSHIVVPRLFDHDKCYFFQGDDGRIAFAIPYEQDFTLIGTTDADHAGPDTTPVCSEAEAEYLREFMATYLNRPIAAEDIVWTYSGVRALYEDGASSASAATRDYVLRLNDSAGAPMLNVFGGKITTYRRLAEAAMAKLGAPGGNWTAGVPLPGGEFPVDGVQAQIDKLLERCDFLDAPWAGRLIRTYGTQAAKMLGDAVTVEEMGTDFGAGLTAREVDWLIDREFASTPDDVLWRRSKLGLRLDPDQVAALGAYMAEAAAARAASVTARSSSVSARQG